MTETAVQLHKEEKAVSFTKEQIELIKRTVAKGATDDELALFLYQAKRTGLDPLNNQIKAIKRWDSSENREKMAIQTGIDGYRLIAGRTGLRDGEEPPLFCGPDGIWTDAWVKDQPPTLAKVVVYKKGESHPYYGHAKYKSYVQLRKDGQPNRFWASMPEVMLAKCAEAQALRKAFPQELAGIYTDEEMGQASNIKDTSYEPSGVSKEVLKEVNKAAEKAVDEARKTPAEPILTPPSNEPVISQGKGKLLYALAMSKGMSKEILAMNFKAWYGVDSVFKLPVPKFEEARKRLEALPQVAPPKDAGDEDNQDIPW